ncbi:5306_t:CDS:2, partial [Gigaspora rosea]
MKKLIKLSPFQVSYKNDTLQLNIARGHWRSVFGGSDVTRGSPMDQPMSHPTW